eukprot:CAMPEP_0170637746 /NCGR_PEP_ID=MMETSP0224-20130122/38599_1 /TAXON_ID=285029 /ORGANISM="Togula jolla, Strain CCCM 725" /LENGTH=73 /DNA_ID=CAMNT_0010967693 /DNA_START=71 /DNA_END=289 /DNA_ORIENTATION=-
MPPLYIDRGVKHVLLCKLAEDHPPDALNDAKEAQGPEQGRDTRRDAFEYEVQGLEHLRHPDNSNASGQSGEAQ